MKLAFHDHSLLLGCGILIFFITLTSFNAIRSYATLSVGVALGSGPVAAFVAAIAVLIGGVLCYRETKRELMQKLYIEHEQAVDPLLAEYRAILEKRSGNEKDKNMSLPI